MILSVFLAWAGLASQVSAACSRSTLQKVAAAYVGAQASGKPILLRTGQSAPSANTCGMGAFPQPLKVANRRYIIDEELGAVDIFNGFPWLEATKPDGSVPSTNLIRVEKGLIRYIHEVTVCETPHCGR